jgi:hypothetical protein
MQSRSRFVDGSGQAAAKSCGLGPNLLHSAARAQKKGRTPKGPAVLAASGMASGIHFQRGTADLIIPAQGGNDARIIKST